MQRKRGGGGSPAFFDSKELFVRFVFVCDFNKKKEGRDLSSSQVFSSNRESIDVSRFVAIAKHDAIFFLSRKGGRELLRLFVIFHSE